MRRIKRQRPLASGTALGVLLLAAPALGQPSPGHTEDVLRQMRNEQQPGTSQDQPAQRAATTEADWRTAGPEPIALVTQAQAATRRNRVGEAAEMLERAETRLLTRAIPPAADADQPMRSPAVERIGAARAALHSLEWAGALREMDLALAAMRAVPGDGMATGTGAGMMQMQGGGIMMPPDGDLSGSPIGSPLGSPGMGSMGSAPAPLLRGPPE